MASLCSLLVERASLSLVALHKAKCALLAFAILDDNVIFCSLSNSVDSWSMEKQFDLAEWKLVLSL